MAKAATDRRPERTRKALRDSFIQLVLTRSYAAINVADIAAVANVGRSTFYLYYTGKLDLLKQTFHYPCEHLAAIVGGAARPETVVPILTHFLEQRKINRPFFEPPIRDYLVSVLAGLIEPRLAALARARAIRPSLPPALMARQVAEAQLGLVVHWLKSRASIASPVVAAALIETTNAMVEALLGIRPDSGSGLMPASIWPPTNRRSDRPS